jgi:hypothetical protein
MGKFIDRTGQVFGRLRVVERVSHPSGKGVFWKCFCNCGKEVVVVANSLTTGNTTSCGCYHKEVITKHGGWRNPSYNTWRAMLRRCLNKEDKDYFRYGASGITVDPSWLSYTNFVADMGEPEGNQTLDRIDNTKGYFKENCRWASPSMQAINSRRIKARTGHRGVFFYQKYNKYIANITHNKKRYYSRVFDTAEEAVKARKELELRHWGSNPP